MRVLVIGSGGREHALAWAIHRSPRLESLFIAPGNPGTAALGTNVAVGVEDIAGLVALARRERIDLVVPGPDATLAAGIADACAEANIACCGPTKAAARLEGSKAFAKELADAAGIPTAAWESFTDLEAALTFVRRRGAPIVVKADGLALGKGVVVAATLPEAEDAVRGMMEDGRFGEAGSRVVIEECLRGPEMSVFALCDGEQAVFLGDARDHKRVGDGDTGPNTGGMGAVSPAPHAPAGVVEAVMDRVIRPALRELARRGCPYRGVLYAGLMLTEAGPKLIEFNARFGDPECQTILPRLRSDLLTAFEAACGGGLADLALEWRDESAVTVVLAARGYPGAPTRGGRIEGLEAADALPRILVFQAGTALEDGVLVAAGGRVLNLCALGVTPAEARERAYRAVEAVRWADGFCRRDIGG